MGTSAACPPAFPWTRRIPSARRAWRRPSRRCAWCSTARRRWGRCATDTTAAPTLRLAAWRGAHGRVRGRVFRRLWLTSSPPGAGAAPQFDRAVEGEPTRKPVQKSKLVTENERPEHQRAATILDNVLHPKAKAPDGEGPAARPKAASKAHKKKMKARQ